MAIFLRSKLGKPVLDSGESSPARKFTAPVTTQAPPTMVSNAETIANLGSAGSNVASAVEKIAEQTRIDISALESNPPNVSRQLSPDDVKTFQQDLARRAVEAFAPEPSKKSIDGFNGIVVSSLGSLIPTSVVPQNSVNEAVPEIDHIVLNFDPGKGVGDPFCTRLTFSISREKLQRENIGAIRIFRSEKIVGSKDTLSLTGMGLLASSGLRNRSKNDDAISKVQTNLSDASVENFASTSIPFDPVQGIRSVVETIFSGNESNDNSVAVDLKTLRRVGTGDIIKSTHTVVGNSIYADGAHRIQREQIEDTKQNFSSKTKDRGNFKEIAFLTPSKLSNRVIGDLVEYVFDDTTVTFGRSYSYYITTIDSDLNESPRSKIVSTRVEGLRVPECPKKVDTRYADGTIVLNVYVEDMFVEKFEIYRRTTKSNGTTIVATIDPRTGVSSREFSALPNDFSQIGECSNNPKRGSMFVDRTHIIPGREYEYRVYSVDIFGNKSERPYETKIFVPDRQSKHVDLLMPTIQAEVDSKTGRAKVSISCIDDRVVALKLSRRDIGIRQKSFTVPSGVSLQKLGHNPGRTMTVPRDVALQGDGAWSGFFPNPQKQFVFNDEFSEIDHTYQYQVRGVDRFGNETSCAVSRPIFVSRRPLIDEPLNLSAGLVLGPRGIEGVRLNWQRGNIDTSPQDLLGDREVLENTSVRTVYQIQRRDTTDEIWRNFPFVDTEEFFDRVSDEKAPAFRPSHLEVGKTYFYRIAALQTGGFVSNFTEPVKVDVVPPVLPVVGFRALPSNPKVRPMHVALNWNTDERSGPVDRWEIERVEINNLAAGRINVSVLSELAKLEFKPFRTVYLESSRSRSRINDEDLEDDARFVGQHHFIDSDVTLGNSYFYRIRAVAARGGSLSPWSYRGAKLTDHIFERKLNVLVSDEERAKLIDTSAPLVVKSDFLEPQISRTLNSLNLNATPFNSLVDPKKRFSR